MSQVWKSSARTRVMPGGSWPCICVRVSDVRVGLEDAVAYVELDEGVRREDGTEIRGGWCAVPFVAPATRC
jgi:hypothetical protein